MKISIRPLLSGEKTVINVAYTIPMDITSEGCRFTGDAEASVEVKSMGGYTVMNATCKADYVTACARCLDELQRTLTVTVERPVGIGLSEKKTQSVIGDCEDGYDDGDDEYLPLIDGDTVDPDELLRDELILSLPFRSLCSEDCKGLCPKCGCNKNRTECACVLNEPDPRWNVLKKFLEDKKNDGDK